MTSRERVIKAINHIEPDKVPVDLGSTPSSGISAIAYSNLVDYLGVKSRIQIYDVVQQLAQPDDSILDQFGIDVIDIGRLFNAHEDDWIKTLLPNGREAAYPAWFKPVHSNGEQLVYRDKVCIARMPRESTFFDQTYFPYENEYPKDFTSLPDSMAQVLWASLAHSPWDHAHQPDFWKQLRTKTLALRQQTDKALMIVCGCNLFEWGTFLRRIDLFLMDLLMDTQKVNELLDALLVIHLNTLENVCKAVGDIVDIIRLGDDLGMDTGPFISPGMYREYFKPRHKIFCDYIKQNSNMHILLHSCGSIYKLLPDLIDAGFEIINPVQTNCADMEPERLKKEFGRDITFWGGGIDTRHILNNARPPEIREHVLQRLYIFSSGGGYIFNPVHNILPDVPPENIIAMFDAVSEFNNRL